MSKKVIFITSHDKDVWDGGDSVITDGIKYLLPELYSCEVIFSNSIPHEDTDNVVSSVDYVIHGGTPSWITGNNRRFWKSCMKYGKHISMLGIGLAQHYLSPMWYGPEDFVNLSNSGLIDLIICRDKFCYYWLCQRLGYPADRIFLLPCPGFYPVPVNEVDGKNDVIFSLANLDETSRQTDDTFLYYYEKCATVVEGIKQSGANVHLLYQRNLDNNPSVKFYLDKYFPGEKINWFDNYKEFAKFIFDKSVYIGVRNHGALPSAGSGKPSLLLGTDYRQYLAEEIPFISRMDISYAHWQPRFVLDWYSSLDIPSISYSLINYRRITERYWYDALGKIRHKLTKSYSEL